MPDRHEADSMLLLWMLAGAVAVTILVMLVALRRLSHRLDLLQHAYWELRYDYTELRARVTGSNPGSEAERSAESVPPDASFIPLSSVKLSSQKR
jgi:hypothetical protein